MSTLNAQCLIFVPCNKRRRVARASQSFANQREIRGFVLIREEFVSDFPEVIEFFSHCDMQILTSNQDHTNLRTALENQRFGIFEVQLEYKCDPLGLRRVEMRTRSRNVPGPFCIRVCGDDNRAVAQLLLRVDESDTFYFNLYSKWNYATAINELNLEILRNILPYKVEVDNLHSKGGTILNFAAKIGEGALLDLLLEKKCCVNPKGLGGLTPLHIAAKDGHIEIVESLLQHGADVNARATFESFKDCTPLVLSVRYGHLNVCKALLSHGSDVDVNFDSDLGKSILELAVKQKQHFSFVEAILEFKPDVNNERHRKALLIALCYQQEPWPYLCDKKISLKETVHRMLEYGISVDIEQVSSLSDLLFGAVHKNCIEIVEMVLQRGVDVNELRSLPFAEKYSTSCRFAPLHVAVMNAEENIVRLLIGKGADVNANTTYKDDPKALFGESPTAIAVKTNQLNIVKLLLLNGAAVRNDPTVMREAALTGNIEIIQLLLQNGAPLTSKSDRDSPLRMATRVNNIELLEFLFNYGVDLSSVYEEPKPKLFTDTSKRPKILQFLLDQSFTNPRFITTSGIVQFFCDFTDDYNSRFRHYFDSNEDFQVAFKSSAYIIACHIIKLESADLFASDQNVASIWYSQENIDDFRNACAAEIANMKQDKVCAHVDGENEENKTTVTFYDILTQNVKQVAGYAKNETVVEAMETECYKNRFPIFASVIKCQFQKGHHRAKLVTQGVKSANHLFKNCKAVASKKINMEMILDYLSNCDLLSLTNVFPVQT